MEKGFNGENGVAEVKSSEDEVLEVNLIPKAAFANIFFMFTV